ncbi:MAG: ABC transporter ATP-binding protein, partial [Actinobacteria bacterium]|nr:ABC transporter ATP-binding protein [Actinomycetota bacterium]
NEVLLEEVDERTQASNIGYVLQNPDNQIVTDKVWHELSFGLESLGYDSPTIRLRVAEMASFFGVENWFNSPVSELSGGQKQLLNLASIMAMHPSALVLDEPTSQLDPIAASDFLATIKKINREIGTTIIVSEHRLEEVLPMADRVIVLDHGAVCVDEAPSEVGYRLKELGSSMLYAMPTPTQAYLSCYDDMEQARKQPCPITVREGKQWIEKTFDQAALAKHELLHADAQSLEEAHAKRPSIIEAKDVWFRYEKDSADVLKDLSFSVKQGELSCIVGGNGAGKTTALMTLSGVLRPYRGKITLFGEEQKVKKGSGLYRKDIALLPQNPQCLFVKRTVREDLELMLDGEGLNKEEVDARIDAIAERAEITELLGNHPYDLSGGEQQRAALAKVLLKEPQLLLLDEPTKGMDGFFKKKFANTLVNMKQAGATIVMISHDIEFCAEYADRCSLLFDGTIVTEEEPRAFFSGNSFYTTAANRMARHIFKDAITLGDIVELCKQEA